MSDASHAGMVSPHSRRITQACGSLQAYAGNFRLADGSPYISTGQRPPVGAPHLLPLVDEIEHLRPKSPPPIQRH